jgi:hypothetical protein
MNEINGPSLKKLFLTFMKLGATAFGGGFAAVPIMFHEVVGIYNWLDKKALNGILCCFVGLLLVVVWHFSLDIHWNLYSILLAVSAFTVLLLNIEVVWVIVGGIIASFFMN